MSEFLDALTRFPSTQSVFGFTDVLLNIAISLICAMIINVAYRRTHRSMTYSESYLTTLVMMACITSVIMMIIGSNIARAFSLVGALSIIRFRTAVKDIKDTAFIFFAIAIGMAVGTGFYVVAFSATVTLSLLILGLDHFGYGRQFDIEKLLTIEAESGDSAMEDYSQLLRTHTRYFRLIHTDLLKATSKLKLTYTILSKDRKGENETALLTALKQNNKIQSARIITGFQDNLIL